MKILFVCGSIEPGHDGVGDYTRELAGALHSHGVEVMIVGLMDRSITGKKSESQISRGKKVKTLRLSAHLSDSERKVAYTELISEFDPDIISLQYVPYAFSAKGVPFNLPRFLKTRHEKPKWHFMIHEAYVWHDLRFKRKLLSRMQIFILKRLVRKLEPVEIQTSIPFYQNLLREISIKSDILGLFGNIEILPDHNSIKKPPVLQGLYFGAGPLSATFGKFSEGLKNYYLKKHEKINLVFCGRPDFRTKDFIDYLKKEFEGMSIDIIEKGPLEPADLSASFLESHFGISRESDALIGKSGTAIAMLEHGMPIWVPLHDDDCKQEKQFDFRKNQCFTNLEEIDNPIFRNGFQPERRLDDISAKFLQSLPVSVIKVAHS